eukprot:1345072-Amorphochlora_amoeboformis.AAC.1
MLLPPMAFSQRLGLLSMGGNLRPLAALLCLDTTDPRRESPPSIAARRGADLICGRLLADAEAARQVLATR